MEGFPEAGGYGVPGSSTATGEILNATGPIASSAARAVDQLTGVGFGVTVLILALIFSVLANIMQYRRNNSLVDQMFNFVPQATAKVMEAVAQFKEAVDDLIKKN